MVRDSQVIGMNGEQVFFCAKLLPDDNLIGILSFKFYLSNKIINCYTNQIIY